MNLTKLQKDFVRRLLAGEIRNIKSFLELDKNKKFKLAKSKQVYLFDDLKLVRDSEIKIPVERDTMVKNLKEFLSLWKMLEKNDLVFSIPTDDQIIPIFKSHKDSYVPDNSFISMIKDCYNREFIVLPALKDFSKTFKTVEEIKNDQETNFRRFIKVVTVIISCLSLFIAYQTLMVKQEIKHDVIKIYDKSFSFQNLDGFSIDSVITVLVERKEKKGSMDTTKVKKIGN